MLPAEKLQLGRNSRATSRKLATNSPVTSPRVTLKEASRKTAAQAGCVPIAEALLGFSGTKEDWEVDPRKNKARRLVVHALKMMRCGSAWKRDPGSGVIGVEKGPLIPVV